MKIKFKITLLDEEKNTINDVINPNYKYKDQIFYDEVKMIIEIPYIINDLSELFQENKNITSINCIHFNRLDNISMYKMFMNCENIKEVDMSIIKNNKIENIKRIKYNKFRIK